MGTILMLIVWYEVFMVLFTLVSTTVLAWWTILTFGEEVLERYSERMSDAIKSTRWVSWDTISYLLFWPVLLIFRLNAMLNDIVAFAADSQNEEN